MQAYIVRPTCSISYNVGRLKTGRVSSKTASAATELLCEFMSDLQVQKNKFSNYVRVAGQ